MVLKATLSPYIYLGYLCYSHSSYHEHNKQGEQDKRQDLYKLYL